MEISNLVASKCVFFSSFFYLGRFYVCPFRFFWIYDAILLGRTFHQKMKWDRIPTDPVQQVAIEPLDTQVERGPFRNGRVGDFFLQTSQPICHVKNLHPKLGWDSSWNSGKLSRLKQPPKVPNILRGSGRYIYQPPANAAGLCWA